MSGVDDRLDALSRSKRELLEKLLEGKGLGEEEVGKSAPRGDAPPDDLRMDFSLFFFSATDSDRDDKYRLLTESARFGDRHGFTGIWTPERHFHAFGGLYPSPAVVAAGLATITERIELRAGSVVLPLHHPIRVVEDWSVVDNLSGGRASLSFASGWHMDDFILAPEGRFEERKEVMMQQIDQVRRLWAGEAVTVEGIAGQPQEVITYPRPRRSDPPLWLTSAGNPKTFEAAGRMGLHVLTGLTGQRVEELGEKIDRYRQARLDHGHDPEAGRVALMLHTYLDPSSDRVKELVRQPMYAYLRTNLGLHKRQAENRQLTIGSETFDARDEETLLAFAFERYFNGGGLFASRRRCWPLLRRLQEIGVDEVACLVDFGVETERVLDSLEPLAELVADCSGGQDGAAGEGVGTAP